MPGVWSPEFILTPFLELTKHPPLKTYTGKQTKESIMHTHRCLVDHRLGAPALFPIYKPLQEAVPFQATVAHS
jgi:hypothetical protein